MTDIKYTLHNISFYKQSLTATEQFLQPQQLTTQMTTHTQTWLASQKR